MQSASVNYAHASSGAGGTWADPRLRVDWMQDGYDITPNLLDTFNRNLTDNWGATDTGQTWINSGGTAADFDVVYDGGPNLSSGYGSHTITNPTGTFQTRHSVLNGPLVFVTRQITKLAMPVPTGDAIESLSYYRYVDASNHYRAGVVVQAGGAVTIAIVRAVGGVETVLANNIDIGLSYTGDPQVLVSEDRMFADGTLQARAYIEGTTPPDWQVTVQDTDQILTSGVPGLRTTVYPSNSNVRPVIIKYVSYEVINGLPDDISSQLGNWVVTHHLDDGYPDSVAFISGIGIADLSAPLGPPPSHLTDAPMQVAEYYSPYNTISPIYGRERDVAPVALDHGVITDAGPERIRVFTGQMLDISVKRGQAELSATSAARLALSKLVQPPPAYGLYQGANATWPISYALQACGVYPSPPPQTGCRLWMPFHGSSRAFIPAATSGILDNITSVNEKSGPLRVDPIEWVDGPFVLGGRYNYKADRRQIMANNTASTAGLPLEAGPSVASSTAKGKVELWMLGDDTSINAVPGSSGTISSWFRFLLENTNGSLIDCGLLASAGSTDRKPYLNINDGSLKTFTYSTALPNDGLWHFVGFGWDIAGSKRWINVDGVVETSVAAITASGFPTTDTFAASRPYIRTMIPISEFQLTGTTTTPDTSAWLRDIPFTPGAIVTPSVIELSSIAERQPREAWELISGYAQSELAAMRTDENDIFTYLGLSWWVKDAQQVVVDAISTEFNSATVDLNIDPTKIRNTIRVDYQQVTNVNNFALVASSIDLITILPGTTTIVVPLDPAAVEMRGLTIANIADTDTVQPVNTHSISVNSATDGTGTYAISSQVSATIADWNPGQALVTIVNVTGQTWYLANNKNWPVLGLAAKNALSQSSYVIDSDDASVAIRGERSLSVTASGVQTSVDARRLARDLKMGLRRPVPISEELTLFGDARRQPGDLVTFTDPSMTKVSGLWRSQSVRHTYRIDGEGVDYTQQVILRPTKPIGIWGQSTWGNCLWGENSRL